MTVEYVVMLLYCLIIVSIMLIKAIFDTNLTSYEKRLLILSLVHEFVLIFVETLSSLMSLGYINNIIWLHNLILFIYFTTLALTNFTTFLLLSVITGYITLKNEKRRLIFMIPSLILILLSFISIWTGWVYYIDANGNYARGPINFIQFVVVAFYLTFIGLSSFIKSFMKKYYAVRKIHMSIIFYSLVPLLGVILQYTVNEISNKLYPLILSSFTISSLIIYLRLLQNQVQTDYLTEIPNRIQFMKYLSSKMNHDASNLYLFILDINDFKSINDNFGHLEGDRVLKILSSNLKNFSKSTGYFIARFAGDEFVIIAELKKKTLEETSDLINKCINKANQELNDERYNLSVSIGSALYDESITSIRDFINKADLDMYKEKEKYHNNNGAI